MNYLEKILFIDLTCKQLGRPTSDHPEFFSTWDKLSEKEITEYIELTKEIHEVWSYINVSLFIDLGGKRVNSILEYNELVLPVDSRILTICNDFSISLKDELTDEFKKTVKRILGENYFTWFEK